MQRLGWCAAVLSLGCWQETTRYADAWRDAGPVDRVTLDVRIVDVRTRDMQPADVGRLDITAISDGAYVVEVAFASRSHHCVRMSDGTVRCRGRNLYGALGDGTDDTLFRPVTVQGVTDAEQVVVSEDFSCTRHRDGTVRCWGDNERGQLGSPIDESNLCSTHRCQMLPTRVSDLTGVVDLATSFKSVCAVRDDGSVWCWGDGRGAGPGERFNSYTHPPHRLEGFDDVTTLRHLAGTWFVTHRNGSVTLHGYFQGLTLPQGARIDAQDSTTSAAVCVRLLDATVRCFGEQSGGALGNGQSSDAVVRDLVDPGLRDIDSVAISPTHACAVSADGSLWCWGSHGRGALGVGRGLYETCPGTYGGRYGCSSTPRRVPLDQVTRVFVGASSTCALRTDHTLFCWGITSPEEPTFPRWFDLPAQDIW